MKYYNRTNSCDACGNKLIQGKTGREYNKVGDWTGRWLCNKCRANQWKYGETDIDKIQTHLFNRYKPREPDYNIIYSNIYGDYEEYNKKAIERGYKDLKEYVNKELPNSYRKGEDFWGDTIEKYVSSLFEDTIRMPCNYPFDWICKKGYKIQHKGSHIIYSDKGWCGFAYKINYNDVSDYFIITGWDKGNPLFILLIDSEEEIRGKPFWDRKMFYITNKPEYIKNFEKYSIPDKLDELVDCCNTKR